MMTRNDAAKQREARRMIRAGFCSRCHERREPEQAQSVRCKACDLEHHKGRAVDEHFEDLQPSPWAGERPCRVCAKRFWSDDRRSVTACERCRERQFEVFDQYGCFEAVYE